MSKKNKKPAPASTILAIKRTTPPTTDQPAENDAPSLPPLPEKTSSEVTLESQAEEPKPKFPALVLLSEASNGAGEVFRAGDQIMVSAPWRERVIAEIVMIYEGSECTWVEYKPVEPVKEGWQWERGVMMAVWLAKK